MLVRPSPSKSAKGSAETMFSVLLVVGIDDVLPLPLVATTVKEPIAVEASVRVIVAEVPPPLMFTLETVIAAGVKAGTKENVAPVRLEPLTVKLTAGVFSTCVGAIEVITGTASTVKLLLEVAVDVPTVTLMGPVVAPVGTVVVSWFVVAEVTVVAVPLNFTVFALGVALKFWPWIVTVCPTLPRVGEKLKTASPLGEVVERVIESRFPTAS